MGEDIIFQRCRSYNIPFPNLILGYNTDLVQCEWDFKEPLYIFKPEMIDYWKLVQQSLAKLFYDLGADVKQATDTKGYLFNKMKQSEKLSVLYEDIKHKNKLSLSKIYHALKRSGLIQKNDGL